MTTNCGTRRWPTWWPIVLLALVWALPATAAPGSPAAARERVQLAVAESATGVALDDLLTGRARTGFAPQLGGGVLVVGTPGRSVWLRLRTGLPANTEGYFLSLPRQGIDRLLLYRGGTPVQLLGQSGIAAGTGQARWPGAFLIAIPAATSGPTTLYLEVRGKGYLNLQPVLLTTAQARAQARTSGRLYDLLYGTLFLLGLAALLRRWATGERSLRVAGAAFACLAAAIIGNYHLQLSLGGASLARLPALPVAVWIMACAPLLWASTQYAGLEKNAAASAEALDRLGFAVLAIGALSLLLPERFLPQLQVTALLALAGTILGCAAALASDPRRWRWGPVLVWLGVLAALLAMVGSALQWLPASTLVRRGFQLLVALQLAIYVVLPWSRHGLERRSIGKRRAVVEQSAHEKIAHAREWMISSLQAGIEHAAGGDMQWIAYRRLMAGLKTVLPQTGAAVIAMNFHNEDLLLAEPREAEARFRLLLAQRGALLKNLSRSLAPQQIGVDVTGPDGRVQQVLLAVIPLPIDRPGWGALVIERSPKVSYSDDELDLCTEFAALATTAGDEAAEAMQQRQAREIDHESTVYRPEMIDVLLGRAFQSAQSGRKPMAILRIGMDGFEAIAAERRPELVRAVADVIREEVDHDEIIGRSGPDEFVVLLPGRAIGQSRLLAERILATLRTRALATGEALTLQLSLGAAQTQPGEGSGQPALQRAAKALAKARQYGGNQLQAIAGAV